MRFEKYHSVPKTRLAGDPAHRCSTPQNWLKCSYCAGIRHKCVPVSLIIRRMSAVSNAFKVPEFYQESARSLAIDAAALVADINRRRSDIRSLKSRAKVWRKRIENRMNKKANQEGLATTTVMIKEEIRLRTLKELMRIGDLLAVVVSWRSACEFPTLTFVRPELPSKKTWPTWTWRRAILPLVARGKGET